MESGSKRNPRRLFGSLKKLTKVKATSGRVFWVAVINSGQESTLITLKRSDSFDLLLKMEILEVTPISAITIFMGDGVEEEMQEATRLFKKICE